MSAAGEPLPVPVELVAHAGIRSPSALAATIRAVVPGAPALDVVERLGVALNLPREVAAELDASAPIWLAYPSGAKGHLAIVSARDEARFASALSRALRLDGTTEGLARYLRGDGAPVHVAQAGRHVILVDGPETWRRLGPYALRTLLPRQPADDVELHVHVAGLVVGNDPATLERGVHDLFERLVSELTSDALPADLQNDSRALAALARAARPWLAALAGAREVEALVSLGSDVVGVKLSVIPSETGGARDLVIGTRVGSLLGADRLPPRAWLVAGAHGHPRIPSPFGPIAVDLAVAVAGPDADGEELRRRLADVAARPGWTGDYTLTARSDPDGTRFASALLLGATDAPQAEKALSAALASVARPRPATVPGALSAHRHELPSTPGGASRVVDTAAVDGIVFVTFGEGADRQIAELSSPRPRDGAAGPPELQPRPGRDGVARLAPLGLARTFVASLPLEQRVLFRDVMSVRDGEPVTVSWGVDPARTRWTLEIRVPISSVTSVVRPFVDKLRRSARPGAGPIGW